MVWHIVYVVVCDHIAVAQAQEYSCNVVAAPAYAVYVVVGHLAKARILDAVSREDYCVESRAVDLVVANRDAVVVAFKVL